MKAAFPDWTLTLEELIAQGDRVAFRAIICATHNGVFQSISPTGKTITVSALDIVRTQDGKLVEHWGGPDIFDVLQQLGAVVMPVSPS